MRFRLRVVVLSLFVSLTILLLVGRLAQLQLVHGEALRKRADNARMGVEMVRPLRGRIVDRDQRVLAAERAGYSVGVRLGELERGPAIAYRIARIVRARRQTVEEAWWKLQVQAGQESGWLGLWTAPSEASVRAFDRLSRREGEGLRVVAGELQVHTDLLDRRQRVLARLAVYLDIDLPSLHTRVERALQVALIIENRLDRGQRLDTPLVLEAQVSFDTAARLEERRDELPGVVVDLVRTRRYLYGDSLAHVLGYLGALTRDEVQSLRASKQLLNGYRSWKDLERFEAVRAGGLFVNARIGRVGIEGVFEDRLRGMPGAQLVERNRKSGARATQVEYPVTEGETVALSIAIDVQREAERLLKQVVLASGGRGGALVLLEAERGQVLSLASYPRFDANTLRFDYPSLLRDDRRPLLHRALRAQLPPGSTIKPLVAALALSLPELNLGKGQVSAQSKVHCRGFLYSPRAFKCNARSGHGDLNLADAIACSCNIYFYKLGEVLGPERLSAWLRQLGFGEPTGIGLPEASGRVPDRPWVAERKRQAAVRFDRATLELYHAYMDKSTWPNLAFTPSALRGSELASVVGRWQVARERKAYWRARAGWQKGDSRNLAIGQGDLLVTPVQLAQAIGVLANDGRLVAPKLGGEVGGARGRDLEVSPEALRVVKEGMRAVVAGPNGTARRSVLVRSQPGLTEAELTLWKRCYAKTGTAQATASSHAWICGWLPRAGKSALVFVVVVEHVDDSVHGGDLGWVAARVLGAAQRSAAK